MQGFCLGNANVCTPGGRVCPGHIVVSGDRISAVMDSPERPPVETIDLAGAFVLPGFVDTHVHLTSLALKSLRCDLSAAGSARGVGERLASWAAEHAGPAVVGVDWDESAWEDPTLLTRAALDAVDSRRPVLARRVCCHLGVANSALLDRLPPHGDLVDPERGVIREHALWEANRLCDPEPAQIEAGFGRAIGALHRLGVTAIHDIVSPDRLDGYLAGVARARGTLRIDMLLDTEPAAFDGFRRRVEASGVPGLRAVGIKRFLDGSLGARTAAVNAPYAEGGGTGTLLIDTDTLGRVLRTCADGGFVCAMHAIGDRAIDTAVAALSAFPSDAAYFRIEHAEMTGPAQIAGLARAPAFLSLQPNFVRNWGAPGGMYARALGPARFGEMNRFAALAESGVEFVFGSDGMPPGPLYGVRGATEHPSAGGRLSVADAIERYTARPHRLGPHRREAGRVERGRLADLVVLDKNPFEAELDKIRILKTIVGGRVVFEASPGLDTA